MARISVLIPQRDAGNAVAAQLPEVCRTLEEISLDHEVIVIDDASLSPSLEVLESLVGAAPRVRLVTLSPACGLSAALTAGLAAATGDYIVTLPAGDLCTPKLIELLLDALVRSDLVVGRPSGHGIRKTIHRLKRIPRWFLLGLEVRDPECLVWAARREAIAGVQMPRGMYRYLATLVAARGYRVGEVTIPTRGRSVALSDGFPHPFDLLAAWWFKQRWNQPERIEVLDASTANINAPCETLSFDEHRTKITPVVPPQNGWQESA